MAREAYQAPRGTRDLLPEDLVLIRHLERTALRLSRSARYSEIRSPLMEETRLFSRSLGETSDVVEKEMFTVAGRGESSSSYTFRPEGTAGAARAYVQGGFPSRAPLQKWFYVGPMFRYERPQKGRERQFSQFGIEAFGSQDPRLDAEVVDLAMRFFEELGFGDQLEVRVNTMGDGADRDRWREALKDFFAPSLAERCEDCRARFERNVFRLLDCKVERCQRLNEGAPTLRGMLAPESAAHHERFLGAMEALGRAPKEDPTIVRGLDYYTRTIFEIHYPPLGARSALCGGGRYDGLVEEVGGPSTPAVGFAIGFTATELALAELGLPPEDQLADLRAELGAEVYCVAISDEEREAVLAVAGQLRRAGVPGVELDFRGKSPKAQFKEAGKLGAKLVVVIGPEEREASQAVLKDMAAREERRLGLDELLEQVQLHLLA